MSAYSSVVWGVERGFARSTPTLETSEIKSSLCVTTEALSETTVSRVFAGRRRDERSPHPKIWDAGKRARAE
eukprot:575856-Amphidinium_carterae.1